MSEKQPFMWTLLLHLGSNMFNEQGNLRGRGKHRSNRDASPFLRFDAQTWNSYLSSIPKSGANTVIINIGEALFYETHPEIAVAGSWKRERLLEEIGKLQSMGLEVIPKLNFSAAHDIWLGEYSKMLSTKKYYEVCADLIAEVCQVFKPRYFHLGMDEERPEHQKNQNLAIIRQYEQWWHDLHFLVDCVEKENARAWVWSDYARSHPDDFVKNMPKSVLQSVWYYRREFGDNPSELCQFELAPFALLEKHGYDQVPTGSVIFHEENFESLVCYASQCISPEHLKGFMQTTWERPEAPWKPLLDAGNKTLARAKSWYESKEGNA